MRTDYDVIVAGAGSFGMSAGYRLAREGRRVLLVDAGDPPHADGSHHGQTRIARTAYTMGAAYVKLAIRAMRLWKELEAESAALRASDETCAGPLFDPIGVVSIGPAGSPFIRRKTESCLAFGIPHRRMSAEQVRAEWPGLSVPDTMEGLYEPDAGVLYSERIVRVYRRLALRHGAELLVRTAALRIERAGAGHVVHTTSGSFAAKRVLVTGGAWAGRLLPELAEAVTPVRKPIGWFEAPADRYGRDALPAFIVNAGGDEEYFGFPDLDGGGLKIGRHDGGRIAEPDRPPEPFGAYADDEAELRRALDRFLPGVGRLLRGQVCLYERTPDESFLLGEVPGRKDVWFAGGGSGHGFKFASAVGESMSRALTAGPDGDELDWRTFSLEGVIQS
ncbi:N-methyl-L-tryptophan oxidase [Paenibacillus flagellatus]|uniref:N-methyl-L-tryptophan oxidase n=1 Tax=Paenibacillus flagellatus TaxID=2211139 RepID=A0A2V5KWH3_9BACL|nr:N-methyl-L-tryptophan oxidase [Paenibacillus flagellatus]PYI54076.1 N-methyl-L-tryptophan oxidase [Paenibacillus flagellatus]